MLVSSNFSFSHGVFKSLILQTRINKGVFEELKMFLNEFGIHKIRVCFFLIDQILTYTRPLNRAPPGWLSSERVGLMTL